MSLKMEDLVKKLIDTEFGGVEPKWVPVDLGDLSVHFEFAQTDKNVFYKNSNYIYMMEKANGSRLTCYDCGTPIQFRWSKEEAPRKDDWEEITLVRKLEYGREPFCPKCYFETHAQKTGSDE